MRNKMRKVDIALMVFAGALIISLLLINYKP